MVGTTMDPLDFLRKHLEEAVPDVLRDLVQGFAELVMSTEVDSICNAAYGERSADRTNKRNGYRVRDWDTRAGSIALKIPKLREGSYFPGWLLEPRRRAERALIAVVAEAYVKGVSTRRVDGLVKSLGIEGISKSQVSEMTKSLDEMVEAFRTRPLDQGPYRYVWVDALALKSREVGKQRSHIANVATLIATAVNSDGYREILNVDVVTTEDGAGWLQFFRQIGVSALSWTLLGLED